MAENSKIEWTENSWNPWLGCDPVHTGCANCYSQEYFRRFGINGVRRKTSEANWKKPLTWNRKAARDLLRLTQEGRFTDWQRPRVFPSLMDPFEEWDGDVVNAAGEVMMTDRPTVLTGLRPITLDDLRRDFFNLILNTPNLIYILATKRPENVGPMLRAHLAEQCGNESPPSAVRFENIHLLYSAADQDTLEAGLPHLLACRDLVPVIGLSLEPLVGPVDLTGIRTGSWAHGQVDVASGYLCGEEPDGMYDFDADPHGWVRKPAGEWDRGPFAVDWVIVGGESGKNARPCNVAWIRSVVEQCRAAGVACFVKQLGAKPWDTTRNVGYAPGVASCEFNIRWTPKHPKGGDPGEWPSDLQGREYPEVTR